MLRIIALLLNLLVSLGSAGWAVAAFLRPSALSRSRDTSAGERFYALMYSARAIPFGLLSGVLPLFLRETAVLWIIATAACVQLLDLTIAYRKRDRKMMLGAGVGTAGHLACFFVLL